ncbi:putative protein YihR [subsurface metagenome]
MTDIKPRFYITEEEFGAFSLYKLQDSHTGEYASVLPYLGGSINNLVLKQGNRLVDIIDGYTSSKDVEENLMTSFKGSNLFPFPNRIEGGKYLFNEQFMQLPLNFPHENNAIHGLVYDQEFKLLIKEDGDIGCTLIIRYMLKEVIAGYPFKYLIEIDYSWNESKLFTCTTKISNLSDESIPVGHGWHPYFIAGNVVIDNLSIQFPSKEILEVNDKGIPTGKSSRYSNFNTLAVLGNTNLDSCFLLNTEEKQAEIIIENKQGNVKYKIWQETGINKYNYLQIYTPPSRKSIAIEPMTCAPNAFNNKKGLIVLAPQERISLTWGVAKME